jgi:hypothetical protein
MLPARRRASYLRLADMMSGITGKRLALRTTSDAEKYRLVQIYLAIGGFIINRDEAFRTRRS